VIELEDERDERNRPKTEAKKRGQIERRWKTNSNSKKTRMGILVVLN
jgi:hypothetical protein